jgi:hypothetical protein
MRATNALLSPIYRLVDRLRSTRRAGRWPDSGDSFALAHSPGRRGRDAAGADTETQRMSGPV